MRNYSHIVSKLYEPAVITPARHAAICHLLETRLAAGMGSARADMQPMDEPEPEPWEVYLDAPLGPRPAASC